MENAPSNRLCPLEQHDREEARNCEHIFVPIQGNHKGDFNTSANRQTRKVEAELNRRNMGRLLWASYQEAPNWRAVKHGSLQLNKEKVQTRVNDQGAHLPCLRAPLRNSHGTERREAAKEYRKNLGEERR